MRFRHLAASALLVGLSATGVAAQRQITLIATITDPTGAEVTTVDPKDVRVTENGVQATILKVEAIDRSPKVQVLIDNGLGIPAESIGDLRKGLRGLLEALPPELEVTLVTTAPQPRFLERPTKDRQRVLAAVDRLVPDTGVGRFVESLHEATERIERDKQQDAAYTIVTVGSSSGDTNVRDRDVKQTLERVQKRRTTVHVVLLSAINRSAGGGIVQSEVGQAAAQSTGGRYENINVANRLATLLPEIGNQMATTLGGGSRQFRITVERPAGNSGDLGKLGIAVTGKAVPSVMIQ